LLYGYWSGFFRLFFASIAVQPVSISGAVLDDRIYIYIIFATRTWLISLSFPQQCSSCTSLMISCYLADTLVMGQDLQWECG